MSGFIRESGPSFTVQRPEGSVTLYRYKTVTTGALIRCTVKDAVPANMYRSIVLVMTDGSVYEVYANGSTGEADIWELKAAGTPPEPPIGPKAHRPKR